MPVPSIPTIPSLARRGNGVTVPASSFSPTALSGLVGWWKADSLALSDGAAVTSWADSSGSGNTLTQGTGANQPIFHTAQQNGFGALTFDGSNDFMATGAFASPTAGCSVFAVIKLVDSAVYRTLFNHAAAATWISPFSRVLVRVTDNTGSRKYQFGVEDASVGANLIVSAAAATFTWQYIECVYDATNQTIYRGGTQLGTQARAGTLTSSTQPVYLGAATDASVPWNGQVGEVIYYNRGLNSTERGQIETYLATKWQI